ncbi:MAG: hypothetical protein LBT40_10405 [Deltaproteobacteria bacterium]|nr:hypothetical protein [Deltaproteobacteria bacterium]
MSRKTPVKGAVSRGAVTAPDWAVASPGREATAPDRAVASPGRAVLAPGLGLSVPGEDDLHYH